MTAPAARPTRLARAVRLGVALALAGAAVYVLHAVHAFGQTRHFTIDEWQYGHATWLVAQGERPYADFYEHHLPALYVLHAPLLPESGDFGERALWLRHASFAHLLAVAASAAFATAMVTGSAQAALLASFLPLAFGFAFLVQVDYRADVFGGALLLAALLLVEANRVRRSRALALAAGALAAVAALSTQKVLLVAALVAALGAVREAVRRRRSPDDAPLVPHPGRAVAGAALVGAAALAAGIAAGVLPEAFRCTVLDALRHEDHYPSAHPAAFATYAAPFLRATWATTLPIVGVAVLFLARERPVFWAIPVAATLLATLLGTTKYPYNFVLLCWLLVLCAVRGWVGVVERVRERWPRGRALAPLLFLAPLAVLPDQLGFAAHTTSNAHQLHLLRKIQRYTGEDDVVIDSAGGALFRDHASYYFHHGAAHREMFADYFSKRLVEDYRQSGALLWIADLRLGRLPDPVVELFRSHYVHVDGDLYGLGFRIPAAEDGPREVTITVLRDDVYHAHRTAAGLRGKAPASHPLLDAVRIDGAPLQKGRVRLSPGPHDIESAAGTPDFLLTPLPLEAFRGRLPRYVPHSPLFEYGKHTRP